MDTEMKPASKFPRWLRLVMGGAACAALTGAAVWYDLTYNGGRLVYPMHSYAFRTTDIPMLVAVALDVLYALYLAFLLIRGIRAQKEHVPACNENRPHPAAESEVRVFGILRVSWICRVLDLRGFGRPVRLCIFCFLWILWIFL